jgi:hypothetical protein
LHEDFREYYPPETRDLVAQAFKYDIEFFGYQFAEQESLPPILAPAPQSSA